MAMKSGIDCQHGFTREEATCRVVVVRSWLQSLVAWLAMTQDGAEDVRRRVFFRE